MPDEIPPQHFADAAPRGDEMTRPDPTGLGNIRAVHTGDRRRFVRGPDGQWFVIVETASGLDSMYPPPEAEIAVSDIEMRANFAMAAGYDVARFGWPLPRELAGELLVLMTAALDLVEDLDARRLLAGQVEALMRRADERES